MAESCIILAAGKGTRMKSKQPKVLAKLLFRPMIDWVVESGRNAGARDICVVVGHGKEDVMKHLEGQCTFASQDQQLGTGHAIMQCRDFLQQHPEDTIIILYGDTPLITSETIENLCKKHKESGAAVTILTGILENPFGYGRIERDAAGQVTGIVEQKDANEEQKAIREINSGIYAFRSADLQDALGRLTNNNTQKEYYITDTVAILRGDGKKVETLVVEDTTEIMGVNDRVQLLEAQEIAKERIFRRLMLSGVTIYEKASTFIAPDAVIGPDTEILPSTIIKGGCVIGEDCVIGPGSELSNMTIGDRTTVKHTVAMDSTIGSDTTVGPFAYVRPKCVVGDHVKVGDFVELKNSNIGEGTKISHLTYVGDSDFGKNINIGCGTVTVNYDGHKKFRTVVEDNCFIGCNTNLVAPVTVHAGSFIAAGSTITDEVPDGSLAIARARQVNKEGWNTKREENYQ